MSAGGGHAWLFRHMVPSSKGASAKLTNGTGKILLQAVEMSKIILEIPIDICYTDSVPLYLAQTKHFLPHGAVCLRTNL